ncbi:hypothetical protein Tco_0616201 [Tanacetum coccineum]
MNEVILGKVTILEERSDWDDDERSGGKVLVIQERLAQNQQEFLAEYLPQWDENLAIQKQESESEWENPFAVKRDTPVEETVFMAIEDDESDDDLEEEDSPPSPPGSSGVKIVFVKILLEGPMLEIFT